MKRPKPERKKHTTLCTVRLGQLKNLFSYIRSPSPFPSLAAVHSGCPSVPAPLLRAIPAGHLSGPLYLLFYFSLHTYTCTLTNPSPYNLVPCYYGLCLYCFALSSTYARHFSPAVRQGRDFYETITFQESWCRVLFTLQAPARINLGAVQRVEEPVLCDSFVGQVTRPAAVRNDSHWASVWLTSRLPQIITIARPGTLSLVIDVSFTCTAHFDPPNVRS